MFHSARNNLNALAAYVESLEEQIDWHVYLHMRLEEMIPNFDALVEQVEKQYKEELDAEG